MDDILSERRLCWLGHVIRMDHQRIPRQVLEVPGFKRGPGCPRTNWRSTVNKDLLRMEITWEEVEVAAQNRSEWRRSSRSQPQHYWSLCFIVFTTCKRPVGPWLWSVAQCMHLGDGWIKVTKRSRRRGTNMEQFAGWSDVIANLQN